MPALGLTSQGANLKRPCCSLTFQYPCFPSWSAVLGSWSAAQILWQWVFQPFLWLLLGIAEADWVIFVGCWVSMTACSCARSRESQWQVCKFQPLVCQHCMPCVLCLLCRCSVKAGPLASASYICCFSNNCLLACKRVLYAAECLFMKHSMACIGCV